MTLSDFIESDLDGLIDDWTEYARTISPEGVRLDDAQLRNSARELLTSIAADMRESQTDEQQRQKSHGKRPDRDSVFNRIARGHADDRQSHGFQIDAVVAEYRALRASVLRRWQQACQLDATAFPEMIRFNEAVDQMIAESVREFSSITERVRDLFTGVVAHDLRSPVGAILNSTRVIMADQNLSPTSLWAGTNLQRGAVRLKLLVDDLFIFTSTRLGNALPVQLDECDVERICHDAVDEMCTTHPDAHIRVKARGKLICTGDAERIHQLLVNLLENGVEHGSGLVGVEAVGDDEWITIAVSNGGQSIPARALPTLFDPLTRAQSSPESRHASPGMGLGLYICRCIAHAHNGKIEVESSESGTVFTVKIPRVAT